MDHASLPAVRKTLSASGRKQLQRVHVTRAHDGEVAMIERGQFGLAQALDHGEHGGIDKADAQVGVCAHKLSDAHIVLRAQGQNIELASIDGLEQRREGIGPNLAREEVVELDQHGRSNHPPLARQPEELHTVLVMCVAGIQSGNDGACI
jgi:hypothetical protein